LYYTAAGDQCAQQGSISNSIYYSVLIMVLQEPAQQDIANWINMILCN
jgi:hypothetical protein